MSADAFVTCARNQLGKQYKWGTAGPDTFDCSGLVAYCYQQATGKEITRSSHQQYQLGVPVPASETKPGDLLFWNTDGSGASHVAIYEGMESVVHAMNEYRDVTTSASGAPMGGPFLGARRIFPEENTEGPKPPKQKRRRDKKRRRR